ncbi:MAG: TRAP transporter small permease [Candidatus Atribacteria bacterium]|nr:TRAP transporter small permease [Candidatus Atribacteria bacterium]
MQLTACFKNTIYLSQSNVIIAGIGLIQLFGYNIIIMGVMFVELLRHKLNRTVVIIAQIILVVMVFTVFSQVIMRYIFQKPLMWSEELSRYLYAYLCFFGISISTYEKTHLDVTFLVKKFPKTIQHYLKIFSMLLMLLIFIIVSRNALLLPKVGGTIRAYSLGIPFWVLSISMVPGFIISSIYIITYLYESIINRGQKGLEI